MSKELSLKAGDWVEVRSREEILATLDENGRLDNLPFMLEMFEYCGQRFRVYKRADKTCDYIQGWSIRRMTSTVHLENVRCDGAGHDGCQAGCLIFWKEAWVNRVAQGNGLVSAESLTGSSGARSNGGICTIESLLAASQRKDAEGAVLYSCQATDVPKFTSYMSFWDPRQYIRDLRSGNLKSGYEGSTRGHRALELLLAMIRMLHASVIGFFNEIQDRRKGRRYPYLAGLAQNTSGEALNLQPGELVEVRSKEEIMATLDQSQKNRGLWFDGEMLPYCGGIYRVLRRVNRIVDEKTGKIIQMKSSCIVLEGVVCRSDFHRLCPRAIYPYWRETWLRRATQPQLMTPCPEMAEACKE